MKIWMNILFYSICFLVLGTVIYRLAFVIPPYKEDAHYTQFCVSSGILATLIAGTAVGFAACFDRYQSKRNNQDEENQKLNKH